MTTLRKARSHLGGWGANRRIAQACGVSNMTVTRWMGRGCLPASEVLGKTRYASIIEALTDGYVTRGELIADIYRVYGQSEAA